MNALSDRIADPSSSVRRAAITALGRIGDARASAGIAGALRDPDPAVRASAASALGQLKDAGNVAPLAAALNDTVTSVRHAVARALAAIDTDAARAARGRVNAGTDEVLRSIVDRAQRRRGYRI